MTQTVRGGSRIHVDLHDRSARPTGPAASKTTYDPAPTRDTLKIKAVTKGKDSSS